MKTLQTLRHIKYSITLFALSPFLLLASDKTPNSTLSAGSEDHRSLDEQEWGQLMVAHVKESVENAYNGLSKLPNSVLAIEGMSSPKVRHLLNNLCSFPGTNYLEIGVWKGSTFISALFGNEANISSAIAMDNWSEFKGPRKNFLANCARFLPNSSYLFYSEDCFQVNLEPIFHQPVNIYLYDGAHTALAQELAFTYYDSILDDTFIAIVDDWNHLPAQEGTRAAFKKLNYHILYEIILPARYNGDREIWWNGFYVAVIQKG